MRLLALLIAFLAAGCGSGPGAAGSTELQRVGTQTMVLTSPAFRHGETIPDRYARTSRDITPPSPPLEWSNAPTGTRSFALILRDLDADSRHYLCWLALNLPADRRSLAEGAGNRALEPGGETGLGGYFGIIPHEDKAHRYLLSLYALDTLLRTDTTPTSAEELEQAAAGHILAKAELMGIYRGGSISLPRFW